MVWGPGATASCARRAGSVQPLVEDTSRGGKRQGDQGEREQEVEGVAPWLKYVQII